MDLGLIGKGRWGQNYINTLKGLGVDVEAKGLVKTRNYPELFKIPGLKGVIIASATDTHFEIAKDLIERGYSVLIEKPITRTYKEALILQKLSEGHKRSTIMAGHIQIYNPGYQELKNYLIKIGKITKLSFKGLGSPKRDDSTVLEDGGPHPIYMFNDLLDKSPDSVSANKTQADNISLEFNFADDIVGKADLGSTYPEKEREFEVTGENGTLTFDWSTRQQTLIFTKTSGEKTILSFPAEKSPLALEILEFVDCIASKREPRTPLSQGVEVMKIVDAFQKSLDNDGSEVKIS